MSIVMSTDAQRPEDRFSFWQDVVCDTFVPLDVAVPSQDGFSGRVVSDRIGPVHLSTVAAGAQRVVRTPKLIAGAAEEYVLAGLEGRGAAIVDQDGRQARLRPGEVALYDTTRPYTLDFAGEFTMHVFMIPRRQLALPDEILARLTATSIRADEGVGALLVPLLSRITRQAGGFDEAVGPRIAASVTALLAAVADERAGHRPDPDTARRALLLRVHEHIDRCLPDPSLSPESIALACHISVRYLHKLFEAEGVTVRRFVQRKRLEACRRELTGRRHPPVTVAAVAHRWGFPSAAHFSRSFRAAYGLSPREFQQGR